ncbi:MAG TPA: hypothetical protein VF121_14205 [Thermoanaerobaculia bacterium]|nr:hypothetical protein [Thermoanaerobaculia bacterium]
MKSKSRVEAVAAFFRPRTAGPAARRAAFLWRAERFVAAQALIGAFYAVLLFFALGHLFSWQGYLSATGLTPRWPVFWLRWVDVRTGIAFILWFHLLGGLLGVTLSGYRWARILVFCSWLEFLAFIYSFGSINHGDHLGLLLSFVLIFLPRGWSSSPPPARGLRAATLLVFSGCQALIMLTYSMSGWWKAGGVIQQALEGEVTYLAPSALARQVAAKLLADESTSLLGPWLIEHAWVGWPLMIGALYLEIFALWAVPRPSLHRGWGLGLILLHVATHLTMGVGFPQNPLWLALFFVLSPFRPQPASWRQALRDLPVFGRWFRRVS